MNIKKYLEKKWITDHDEISKIEDFFRQEIPKESLENWSLKEKFFRYMFWNELVFSKSLNLERSESDIIEIEIQNAILDRNFFRNTLMWDYVNFWSTDFESKFLKSRLESSNSIKYIIFTKIKFKDSDIWIKKITIKQKKGFESFFEKIGKINLVWLMIFLTLTARLFLVYNYLYEKMYEPLCLIILSVISAVLIIWVLYWKSLKNPNLNNKNFEKIFRIKKQGEFDNEILKWEDILNDFLEFQKDIKKNLEIIMEKDSITIIVNWVNISKSEKEIIDYYIFTKKFKKFIEKIKNFYLN